MMICKSNICHIEIIPNGISWRVAFCQVLLAFQEFFEFCRAILLRVRWGTLLTELIGIIWILVSTVILK